MAKHVPLELVADHKGLVTFGAFIRPIIRMAAVK